MKPQDALEMLREIVIDWSADNRKWFIPVADGEQAVSVLAHELKRLNAAVSDYYDQIGEVGDQRDAAVAERDRLREECKASELQPLDALEHTTQPLALRVVQNEALCGGPIRRAGDGEAA